MLVLFVTTSMTLALNSGYLLLWPFMCFVYLIGFIKTTNFFFTSSISVFQSFTIMDPMTMFMSFLLFLIMFVSYLNSIDFKAFKLMSFVFLFLTFFCYEVFTTSHLFLLYFYYEASLVPILFIIIKWGSYPERSISALLMLVYTLLFGAPVLLLIMYLNSMFGSWYYSFYSLMSPSVLFSLMVFLCFSVKLPIYGLHYWLPMAHVEAPTFGSVILASLLLKLGGVGLYRLSDLMSLSSLKSSILSYFMVFIVFSSIVCCYQSDMKRLIAYSSVAHMMVIPFLVLSNNLLSGQSIILVMVLHGLSSTLLFMSVGLLYSMYSSRQLVLMRGLILTSPLFSFLLIFIFLFTLSAPPFPSYTAEVFFILSSFSLSPYMLVVVLLFAFLGLVYNLNWLSSLLFATSMDQVYGSSLLKFNAFMPVLLLFMSLPIISMMYVLL